MSALPQTSPARSRGSANLHRQLEAFSDFGKPTEVGSTNGEDATAIPVYLNEFWTSKQRAASRLHEISYRACFKPQLPRFFIERLTKPGDTVFDPFMGRGTTLLEAALLGRIPLGCDANPLCQKLIVPRLTPPELAEVQARLAQVDFDTSHDAPDDLLVFYHPRTLRQIGALRAYLLKRKRPDAVDAWIQMVALNRLTGHSPGFFSVYTMPPNQAVSVEAQRRINARLDQKPDFRSVPGLIIAKTKSLLSDLLPLERQALRAIGECAKVFACSCERVPKIADESVSLVVTSPPFLNVVDYAADNWLRCWFAGLAVHNEQLSVHKTIEAWQASMGRAFDEMFRVVRPGGWVAFEVGEVQRGRVRLEEAVLPAGRAAGFKPELVLINSQQFTKTANCWGVRNNDLGTNTNRVVLLRKPCKLPHHPRA